MFYLLSSGLLQILLKKMYNHIRMISEGSCDTKDWSNDAENSALHHSNSIVFLNVKIEVSYFKM